MAGERDDELEARLAEMESRLLAQIGHDLHDSLGQELTALALNIRVLEGSLERTSPELAATARDIRVLAENAIRTTEALARGLSPVLASAGLARSLEQLAENARRFFGIDCTIVLDRESADRFVPAAASELYRIAQEAVTNGVRHGGATHVEIGGRLIDGRFVLEIADDGAGIALSAPDERSMGLHIMRYRARHLGGRLTIERRSAGGTRVVCSVPAPT